jgi:hypothetical protein
MKSSSFVSEQLLCLKINNRCSCFLHVLPKFLVALHQLMYFKATQDVINNLLMENHMAAVRHLKATDEHSRNFAAKHKAASIPPLNEVQRNQLSRYLSENRRRNAPDSYSYTERRSKEEE